MLVNKRVQTGQTSMDLIFKNSTCVSVVASKEKERFVQTNVDIGTI